MHSLVMTAVSGGPVQFHLDDILYIPIYRKYEYVGDGIGTYEGVAVCSGVYPYYKRV